MSNAAWETLSNQAVGAAGIVYFLALLAHLAEWASLRQPKGTEKRVAVGSAGLAEVAPAPTTRETERAEFLGRLGFLLTVIAAVAHAVSLVGRGMAGDPNRVPWGNMYEFTLTGSCLVTVMYLVLYRRLRLSWMAPLVLGFVLTVLMAARLWLYEPVAPLTEALNSYWLMIHVTAAIIATGAFTLGGIASAVYLVKMRAQSRLPEGAELTGFLARVPTLDGLDRVAYRVHAFAFPVWTFAVLITGPIWAHQAWSRYWNWDPKEVWAFITWVVYAGYLHARATAGWKGRNAALLALLGVATLWWNFIGVNFFAGNNSQHSYADRPPAVVGPYDVRG
ncbi:c-type cytochrome biogenesis protein CcsB [Nocardioides panacisoli]|uniref:C-type cytochrome biogenesis protein CcsB n=1 Tax=Nocardioides panacisoli TaxID=627624 RepID=A0ABP7ICQ5_9ACTN